MATEGTRDERASLSKARLQGREDAPDDVPHPVPGDKSSPLPPASAKAAAAAAQLKARRDRDTSKAKQELPVVSPYQRNAVFGKNGSLVTGRSKKDKHSEKHPSAKTGSGESGKSSLTTDAVEQGTPLTCTDRLRSCPYARSRACTDCRDSNVPLNRCSGAQKNKKIPLRVLPKIRPSLTKSVLGVSNFSQVRSILLQQQDSYVQQVADFQRIIARQHFASSRRPKPRAEECPEVEDRPAEPLRGKRSGKTSAFREMGKKSSVEKTVHPVHPKKSLSARASREQKAEHAAPSKDAVKSTNEGDNKRSADKRKRPYPAEPGSPCEDSEAKRRPEGYDADLPASAAAASYDAAMAAYSYHQHMMHQMAAAGMPPPGMPSPASYPPSMDPYAMQYMAAMQNPNWYFGYGAPSSSSRGYSKY